MYASNIAISALCEVSRRIRGIRAPAPSGCEPLSPTASLAEPHAAEVLGDLVPDLRRARVPPVEEVETDVQEGDREIAAGLPHDAHRRRAILVTHVAGPDHAVDPVVLDDPANAARDVLGRAPRPPEP